MTELRYSFCGKKQSEVARLIAGATVYICNECMVLCVGILNEDFTGMMPGTTGQLLVRFVDGTVHACEQQHKWQPFTDDGESLEWCAAAGSVRSQTLLAVLAVRRHGAPGPVIGATFPSGSILTETAARGVMAAFGGASRLKALHPSREKHAAHAGRKTTPRSPFPPGLLTDQEITSFLSQQYRVPTIDLEQYEVAQEVLHLIPRELCETLLVLPVSRAASSLIIAMVDPTDEAAREQVKRATGFEIEPVIASEKAIRSAIERYYAAED